MTASGSETLAPGLYVLTRTLNKLDQERRICSRATRDVDGHRGQLNKWETGEKLRFCRQLNLNLVAFCFGLKDAVVVVFIVVVGHERPDGRRRPRVL